MNSAVRELRRAAPEPRADLRLATTAFGAVVACVVLDAADAIATWIDGRGVRWAPLASMPGAIVRSVVRMSAAHTPTSTGAAVGTPVWLVATVLAVVVLLIAGGAVGARSLLRRPRRTAKVRDPGSARWASREAIAPLLVGRRAIGRIVVGRLHRTLVAVEGGHSLLVVGPTQSGKTSGLVIPAILEWTGPVIATSVKRDLLEASLARRRSLGEVAIFDPTGSSGERGSFWNPLDGARSWLGAKRLAANLCGVARAGSGDLEEGAFWYGMAEKLLAPLLFAAANSDREMADVVRWVDLRLSEEPLAVLADLAATAPWQAAVASFDREDRQLSSVYATVESVLAAFAEPRVGGVQSNGIDPQAFFGSAASTLYLIAPAREQERLAPVFVALLGEMLEAAFERGDRSAVPPDRRLLLVLDEAANIAPVRDLDVLASTAASHGIQLVTVFQDVAQITSRYREKGATIVNNHRARLLCSGVADPRTLDEMSVLIGESDHVVTSRSQADGQTSTTWSRERRALASGDVLRRIDPGTGVLIYGHLAPARVRLRPWFAERALRRLARPPTDAIGRGPSRTPLAVTSRATR